MASNSKRVINFSSEEKELHIALVSEHKAIESKSYRYLGATNRQTPFFQILLFFFFLIDTEIIAHVVLKDEIFRINRKKVATNRLGLLDRKLQQQNDNCTCLFVALCFQCIFATHASVDLLHTFFFCYGL